MISLKELNSFLGGKYLGKQDLPDGQPITLTLASLDYEEVKSQAGTERLMVARWSEVGAKPWIVKPQRLVSLKNAIPFKDPAQWGGQRVEIFNDINVPNPQDPSNPGGLRARAVTGPSSPAAASSAPPSVGPDGLPLMTYKQALDNCLELDIPKVDLVNHLKAAGHASWTSSEACSPLARQLLDAKARDMATAQDQDNASNLDDEIAF